MKISSLIDFNYLRFIINQSNGVISREKRISLPPIKDTFTRVVAQNNQNRKAFMRNITSRR